MKAWIFSDLHLQQDRGFPAAVPEADVCICAGNIGSGGLMESVGWLGETVCPHMPVVLVPGNRDYRGPSIPEVMEQGRSHAARFRRLHILDEQVAVVGGVRFLGATLWSDLALFGDEGPAIEAAKGLADYTEIRTSRTPRRRYTPWQSIARHHSARLFLERQLSVSPALPTVVVTHYAPSLHSVPNCLFEDPLAPSFASNVDRLILQFEPRVWIHGHIPQYREFPIGKTRMVCNARGHGGGRSDFVADLVVDLLADTGSTVPPVRKTTTRTSYSYA
ncbi:metallophosphoesterase [Rhizobium sp. R693]|uniref:metallophosphoesterase n=1 Tax=Rhizobium sp. R693 TaxID=1764276 RepID=UPI000B5326C5|nr:metallophosphoesterase [Rhizobium sp. R693]OWV90372.1 hypothetical protein ATY79_28425 [Rhizobium sp. R693]